METTQFLYTVQPVRPGFYDESTPEEDRIVTAHFHYLKALCDRGDVLLAGRTLHTDPTSFGLVILRAGSACEAQQIMLKDPAVEAGVFRAQLHPFRTALASTALLPPKVG